MKAVFNKFVRRNFAGEEEKKEESIFSAVKEVLQNGFLEDEESKDQ